MGLGYLRTAQYEEALDYFEKAAALNQGGRYREVLALQKPFDSPEETEELWLLQQGIAYIGLHALDQAVDTLSKTWKDPPLGEQAQLLLGLCYVKLDNPQKAKTLFKTTASEELKSLTDELQEIVNVFIGI